MHRFGFLALLLGGSAFACGDDIPTVAFTDTDMSTTADPSTGGGPATTTEPPSDDTGSTSTDGGPDPSTGSTGGPAGTCGNRMVEAGEECDDGNREDGDACYADCTIAYEVQWTASLHGGFDDDVLRDVVVDDRGTIYAVGTTTAEDGDEDAWIVQIMPDGRMGWSTAYNGDLDGNDALNGVAWLDGELVAVGSEQRPLGFDGLVVRVDPADGAIAWAVQIDGPSMSELGDGLSRVAATDDGGLIVAGRSSVDASVQALVARLDGDGGVVWEQTYGGDTDDDSATALLIGADADIHVAGVHGYDLEDSTFYYRRLDADGNEIDQVPLDYLPLDLSFDANGDIVVAGSTRPPGALDPHAVLELRGEADFSQVWSVIYEGPSQGYDEHADVALLADGSFAVAGSHHLIDEQLQAITARYTADGDRRWLDEYGGDLHLDEQALGVVAIGDSEIVVVGTEVVFGESSNGWVRKFTLGAP